KCSRAGLWDVRSNLIPIHRFISTDIVQKEADTVTSFCALVDTCVVASHEGKKGSAIPAGALVFLFCLLFIAVAVPWIDKPGMQTDEVLFAGGIYPPFDERCIVRIFDHEIPIMVMSYVGAKMRTMHHDRDFVIE